MDDKSINKKLLYLTILWINKGKRKRVKEREGNRVGKEGI